jgi:hypothetical protein
MTESDQTNKPSGLLPNKKGEGLGGRKKGTPNKVTQSLRQAILMAAEAVGSNGKGAGGLVGYLKSIAIKHPKIVVPALLAKLLPHEINARIEQPAKVRYQTVAEARQAMLDHGYSERTVAAIEQSMLPPWPVPPPLLPKKDLQ